METLVHRLMEMRTIESRSALMLSQKPGNPSCFDWRIQTHLDETYHQIKNLDKCLTLLGVDDAPVMAVPADPCLDYVSLYVWKHLEIAHYLGLIVLAEQAEEDEIAALLCQNLGQDSAMAHWLQEKIAHPSPVNAPSPPSIKEMLIDGQYQ